MAFDLGLKFSASWFQCDFLGAFSSGLGFRRFLLAASSLVQLASSYSRILTRELVKKPPRFAGLVGCIAVGASIPRVRLRICLQHQGLGLS